AVFDQSPGNSLAVNATITSGEKDFRLVFQSALSALLGPGSSLLSIPGLGTSFQILTEANFWEHETVFGPGGVLFSSPTGAHAENTFRLIYHPLASSPINDRTGDGYHFNAANGDQVILTGTISSAPGSIFGSAVTNGTSSTTLDQAAGAPTSNNPPTVNFSGS